MKSLKSMLALGLTLLVGTAVADAHRHGHHEHGDVPAKMSLDAGRKWSTDVPLRQAMENVRTAMDGALGDIHAGKLSAVRYAELGRQVRTEIGNIVANCKLEPRADAQLHLVIAELDAGAEAMEGKSKRIRRQAGAVKVVGALEKYAAHFDHPGWQALKH